MTRPFEKVCKDWPVDAPPQPGEMVLVRWRVWMVSPSLHFEEGCCMGEYATREEATERMNKIAERLPACSVILIPVVQS